MPAAAREIEIVYGTFVLDARFPSGAEPFPRAIHVTKMGFAARLGDDFAINNGCLAGVLAPRSIRVPHHRALVGVVPRRPAIFPNIG